MQSKKLEAHYFVWKMFFFINFFYLLTKVKLHHPPDTANLPLSRLTFLGTLDILTGDINDFLKAELNMLGPFDLSK